MMKHVRVFVQQQKQQQRPPQQKQQPQNHPQHHHAILMFADLANVYLMLLPGQEFLVLQSKVA
jgi:hypothetical protein